MICVTYIERRPRLTGNYSLEAIFLDVRLRLAGTIRTEVHIVPVLSNGFWPRLRIIYSAWKHQGQVTHVTGDINYAAIGTNTKSTVLTIHDCSDWTTRQDWKGWLLRKFWVEWPVRRAARITTVSEATKRDIVAITRCSPGKVTVIPNAISSKFQKSDRRPTYECPRILQVGTSINKNLSRLIAALRDMQCTLVIVGKLSDEIRSELDGSNVRFENHINISEEKLIAEYEKSDIVAFASTYEGFGMPIVEAQSVGRPVVTSNMSSMPEVAGAGACLVDPFDVNSIRTGFRRIISDQRYRDELISNGFENAKQFDAEHIATQYLHVYQSVASCE
jgi:glycosyltransferase involved in cell wall biosynthesis